MTEKELMQNDFIEWLQKSKIDFFRIGNAAFIRKVKSPYTHAFEEKGPCHKYWPDVTFCTNGKVYMIEFGLPGSHNDQKIMQEIRMRHWHINGGVIYKLCYSWDDCQKVIDTMQER